MTSLPLGFKKTLQIDISDLTEQKEKLITFLTSKHKLNTTSTQNKITVDAEKTTPQELEHAVNKFIYHQHLNQLYYVELKGTNIKINKFKNNKKPEKTRKQPTAPTFAHGF
jgi:hypothetical protein